ncbi:hypothetical protein U1Q18_000403 [Sarracenia purpurea var. burkii]
MEFEQPLVRDTFGVGGQKVSRSSHSQNCAGGVSSPRPSSSVETVDLSDEMETYGNLVEGVPRISDSVENKMCWLRSQIIGGDAEMESPFGKRRLTYADHTASGRCLHYIENYIINIVLPFYGNIHTR